MRLGPYSMASLACEAADIIPIRVKTRLRSKSGVTETISPPDPKLATSFDDLGLDPVT